jgi:hypothetical protein
MATVRIGDFSGGTSEVLDPSLIAPNAAVSSYNLDPRTGVFSPVKGITQISTTNSSYIDFIECDGKHEQINSPNLRSYVRWGDYLLYSRVSNLPAMAEEFDSVTGERGISRPLGLQPVTAAENEALSLEPIRATALTFRDGEHNLSGEIQANIEAATLNAALQYQFTEVHRYDFGVSGDAGDLPINVAPGDWIVMLPTGQPEGISGDVFVGRPGCVVSVGVPGMTSDDTPYISMTVSLFGWIGNGIVRSDGFGVAGLAETESGYVEGTGVALFKRASKTLTEVVAFARSVSSRSAVGYIYPMLSAAVEEAITTTNGGAYYRRTFLQPQTILRASLYDYTIYPTGELSTLLVEEIDVVRGAENAILPYDLVTYKDESPGAVETARAILGVQSTAGVSLGLSAGIYKYAATRVDDWGRESAPWPYLLGDKARPKIDATTEAAAESTLGALFVRVGALPQPTTGGKLNIYRTRADGAQYFFLRKLDTGADFVDTVADFDLSVVPMLAEQNHPPLVVPINEAAKEPEDFEERAPSFLCEYRGTLFAAYKNRLMFSAPGRFYGWPPENYVLLPANITGILPAGDVLLVFTRTKTFRLTGNTFSTMDFRQVSDTAGCVANRTACLVDKRPLWCSLNGVATFDGVRVQIVTDGTLADSSEQWKGATSACSYRGEYYLLLTPTQIEPTRTRKGEPVANEIEPRQRYFLRIKPGAWVTHGVFTGNVTDLRPNPGDGKLYVVGGGQVRKMFEGAALAGYWKSGRLHGGYKTLRKNALTWFVTVVSGTVRVQIEADGEREIIDRLVTARDPQFITFPAGVWFNDLSFAFTGSGVVTEYGFDFEPRKAQ